MNPDFRDSSFGSAAPLARKLSSDIEKAALRLVVDGFERWQMGGFKRVGDHEEDYTIRLVACMKEIRRERNMALVPRYQHVEPSNEMLEGHEDPTHAPHIDITISWDLLTDDAYLSIECKRLAPDDLARLYVVKGIDRFVQGYYGAKAQTGAMIGYVISGTPNVVRTRVNAQVERAQGMGPRHILISANPIGSLGTVFASNHPRSSPFKTIRLTHLFFDMNGIGPPT